MTGLSVVILLSIIWWQRVDFPAPGGPVSKIRLFFGNSRISANDALLSFILSSSPGHQELLDFPLAVRISSGDAFYLPDMLVFDRREEAVKKAGGEEAARLLDSAK